MVVMVPVEQDPYTLVVSIISITQNMWNIYENFSHIREHFNPILLYLEAQPNFSLHSQEISKVFYKPNLRAL